ncbi:MAG: S9 family peptidase [Gemmatimonadetes bacterium]|nr:S9 family peptidase [Gemmatimonadota bacterium]
MSLARTSRRPAVPGGEMTCPGVARFLCMALLATPASQSLAQRPTASRSSIDREIDELAATRRFQQVALTPDGGRIAWVQALPETPTAPSLGTSIYLADLRRPKVAPRRVTALATAAARTEHDIDWSPDNSRLAFLSDATRPGQLQLYVASPAAGEAPRRLTSLKGFLARPRWSPDGKTIALLFTENAAGAAGPLAAKAAGVGVIEEEIHEQRLALVDVATGNVRQLSPADLYVYEYDWSPDGTRFVATAAHGSGDNNWYIAELYTIANATGETQSILKPNMQIAIPKWSPDGRSIAFIGGLMSDEPLTGGDVFLVADSGGTPRNLTPGMKASASWLTWIPSTKQILFTEYVDGMSGIATVDATGGPVSTVWTGAETVISESGGFGFSVSVVPDGKTTAMIRHSFQNPPEVWTGPIGQWKQVTSANRGRVPAWGEAKSIHWNVDRLTSQGWLLFPRGYEPTRRYPLVVVVHGGPAWATTPAWPATFFNTTILASEGYFVLYPNPRGSFGQGEEFTRANVKDFGGGDFRDVLAGVDEVVKTNPIDTSRIGITGWSYGGFMTMWALTQTKRFRAGVSMGGLANWQSYYGENGIDQWMLPFFGASVYDDPAVYAQSSPINFIKNVTAPTLMLVGEHDIETPPPQSYEYWHALKILGIPTQLVVFPGEGHEIAQPAHRREVARRMVTWFNEHLK